MATGSNAVQEETRSAAEYTHGLIIGKFMLLHMGHCFLIDTALRLCKTLHICLCSRKGDVVAGARRYAWMKKTYDAHIRAGNLIVYHITKEIQEAHVSNHNAPSIWAREISTLIPVAFDAVFASENYGGDFAQALNAQFVPIDTQRDIVPVSSTEIQTHVQDYWQYITPAVKDELLIIIGVRGSHQHAQGLAEHLNASMYRSYAMRESSTSIRPHAIPAIAAAQLRSMRSMSKPLLCIHLPPQSPPQQCYEESQCHKVFSIYSDAQLHHALTQAKAMLQQHQLFPQRSSEA